jgi:L-asparaginase II
LKGKRMADNPELVAVTRGGLVESRHAGAFAIVDAAGALVDSAGNIDRPIFPRSAVKAIQALPLVESGAADALGLTPPQLALACASHAGTPLHVATAAAMLARAGRDPSCLECGAHWPGTPADIAACAALGGPTALHNNCSGKHAGFVCLACHEKRDPVGYVRPDHAVQRRVAAALAEVTGADLATATMGIDGCSIPTYAVPLRHLARGFARLASGTGLSADRAAAARRLFAAVFAHPEMVAGPGRFDTAFMTVLGAAAFVKIGAEGVYCAGLPQLGLGIALKIDDGAFRAAEVLVADLVAGLLGRRDDPDLARFVRPELSNWNGIRVGDMRRLA